MFILFPPLFGKKNNTFYLISVPSRRYQSPKRKHSLLWKFAFMLGPNGPHPDIRCLVCSQAEFTNCNVGVTMAKHLSVCTGFTPEARSRYEDAIDKESKKRKFDDDNLPLSKRDRQTMMREQVK